jgi:hypothetical protein
MRIRLLAGISLVLAWATVALAADPFTGTWKMNVAKSKFTGQAPKSVTLKYEAQDNGIKWVGDSVNADGRSSTHTEYAGKYDGKDYPLTGSQNADTISLKRIDANTYEYVAKKAGKEVGRGRNTVSKDGKTMIRSTMARDASGHNVPLVYLYEKQ